MSMVKRFLEDISEEMGLDGEITDAVMAEGERRIIGMEFAATNGGNKGDCHET